MVLGVLIAISIDAGRQGLHDRRNERVLLESLLVEFDFNRDALATQAAVYRRRGDSAEELLRVEPSTPPQRRARSGWPTGRSGPDLVFLSSSPILENFLREEVAWARILDRDITQVNTTLDRIIDGIARGLGR